MVQTSTSKHITTAYQPLIEGISRNFSPEMPKNRIIPDDICKNTDGLYLTLFNKRPSVLKVRINQQDIGAFIELIRDQFSISLISHQCDMRYTYDAYEQLLFGNHDELLIHVSCTGACVLEGVTGDACLSSADTDDDADESKHEVSVYYQNSRYRDKVLKFISDHPGDQIVKGSIFIFEKDSFGSMRLIPHTIQKYDLDIDRHYNTDFHNIDARIKAWCSDDSQINKKLVLLSGEPGTGKTNYIKTLISYVSPKRVIYIPPYQVGALADPGFFSFITKYKNSVLVVEDAERVLLSREDNPSNEAISLMLNLTDGILSSVLNFKVICTFNTDESKIDPALMRKGRLFLKYKFGKLSKDKTLALHNELYDTDPPTEQMSIAEIYENDDNGKVEKIERVVGFGV